MKIPNGWDDITDRLRLNNTFGRHIVTKQVPGEEPFVKMVVPDGVQIIGLTHKGEVVVITETRADTGERYTHLVGGTVDDGETPESTASREFNEETGYVAEKFTLIGTLKKDSAHLFGNTYVFVAEGCRKLNEPEAGMDVEEMDREDAEKALYVYITSDPKKERAGGNSIIALWLLRNWLAPKGE